MFSFYTIWQLSVLTRQALVFVISVPPQSIKTKKMRYDKYLIRGDLWGIIAEFHV